jgi:hypothetical protein
MIKPALILSAVSLALSGTARAQVTPKAPTPIPTVATAAARSSATAGCPGGNGIHISSTSGTLTDSSSGVNTVIGLNQSIDTTLVFDISRKTWTRTNATRSALESPRSCRAPRSRSAALEGEFISSLR